MAVIYQIKDTTTQKCYIGSTINFEKRKREHLNGLKGGYHHSLRFQENFTSVDVLEFSILVEVPDEHRFTIEQEYLDKYRPELNGTLYVTGCDPEVYLKIGEKKRAGNHPLTTTKSETFDAIWSTLILEPNLTLQQVADKYQVPKYTVDNIYNGLTLVNYLKDKFGEIEYYDMLSEIRNNSRLRKDHKGSPIVLVSPEGVEYTMTNIAKFCREHDLNVTSVSGLINDTDRRCAGGYSPDAAWTVKGRNIAKNVYRFLSPNKDLIETTNLSKLAKEYNLDRSAMGKVHSGKKDQHKGWKKAPIVNAPGQ